ncbi:MAG: bacillithiol biosynthesis cysteine-adding enzyme BshC [bacterium]
MRTPVRRMPGTKPLVADYFDNFENVAEFYNGDYRSAKDFLMRTDEVKARDLPLGQLVPILKEQNQRFGSGVQTLEKINLLLERRACAVVTGQQTGLLGGPLYTVYKTLTAIKLAERLSRTCEGCFVPVFWLASDDHDFQEVNHINILDKSNLLSEISYNGHPSGDRIPVSAIKINSEISAVVQQLHDATHPTEFKEDIIHLLKETYQPDSIFSEAFAGLIMQLFKSFGIIIIDGSDPRLKDLGKAIFKKEIAERSPSTQQALAVSERLVQNNYHNQVQLHQNILNLFYVKEQRQTIELKNETFSVKGTNLNFSTNELLRLLEDKPQLFSPNVLLRPLYQDALLPTVAYVAGPAELAYYAQMKGVYECFGMPMPIMYPRKSLTLLESKIEKVLDNYDLHVQDFWGDAEILINNLAKARLSEDIEKRIENASLSITKNLQALEEVVTDFEPTLVDTVENVKSRIAHQIDILEKKILQAYKKRNEVISQQIHKAKNNLYPNNHLQERVLNVVPFLIKYGFGFIDRVYEAMDISNFDHQTVRL